MDLLSSFDESLCDQNSEYKMKRMSKRLAPPRLQVMRPGWSESICRADFGAGRRETQHKWSPLCDGWDATSRAQVVAKFELPPEPISPRRGRSRPLSARRARQTAGDETGRGGNHVCEGG
jgi:hypothetical protein